MDWHGVTWVFLGRKWNRQHFRGKTHVPVVTDWGLEGCQTACKPGSVSPVARARRPFLWDARCRAPRATYPGSGAETRLRSSRRTRRLPLCGLAPGGVFRAAPVAGGAVRSCRTVSPLPGGANAAGRSVLCGTFPGLTPAGCWPAPCFRGARTFLTPPEGGARPSGRLAKQALAAKRRVRQQV